MSQPSTTRSAARTFWRTPTLKRRSNKGAPGVDRQDFEAVEAYGVERWLSRTGARAQAGDLPTEPNQTRVHTEGQRQAQAAGHLNLAGSGLT